MRKAEQLDTKLTQRYFQLAEDKNNKDILVIFYSARSGSTWIGNLISSTGLLGDPREYFNGGWIREYASALATDNLFEYAELLKKTYRKGGVHSVQVCFDHIQQMGGEDTFFTLYPESAKFFFIYRKDIIASAVSFSEAALTQRFHSFEERRMTGVGEESEKMYRPNNIKFWAESILAGEIELVKIIKKRGLKFRSICYEDQLSKKNFEIVAPFAEAMGVFDYHIADSEVKKFNSERKRELLEIFASEHADFVKTIHQRRSEFLDFLNAHCH